MGMGETSRNRSSECKKDAIEKTRTHPGVLSETAKYRPQFTIGKPYVCRSGRGSKNYDRQISVQTVNDGYRYPTSVLQFNTEKGYHPTQKPVALCEYLIKTYSDEGDLVLDCCMGSGTTGIACVNLNRDFIGIEREETYYSIAKSRIIR